MTTAKSWCFIQDKNIDINNKTAKRKATWATFLFAVLLLCLYFFSDLKRGSVKRYIEKRPSQTRHSWLSTTIFYRHESTSHCVLLKHSTQWCLYLSIKKIISAIQFWKVTSTAQACNVRFKMAARKQQVVDNTTRQFCFSKKENRLVVERYLRIV